MAEKVEDSDWKCLNIEVRDKESRRVIEYKVHLYRKKNGWYDEVRYDSHEIKKGKKLLAPHLHIKIATAFKDPKSGEQELRRLIDTLLPLIKEMTQ